MATTTPTEADCLTWDYRLPILTNVFLWYDFAKVFLIVYVIVMVLMTAILLVDGGSASLVDLARVFGLVCFGLFVTSVPIGAVWYANRAHVRFELSPKGVLYRTLERKDTVGNRLLFILGILAGRPSAAGAGLLASSRESEFTRWADITRAKEYRSLGTISLVCGWRIGQRLFCGPDDFAEVAAYVRRHVRRHR